MNESIILNWGLLGAKLANLSDNEQSEFLKGFAFELNRYESNYKIQIQMFSIKDKLNKKEIKILEESFSCLWYKE